MSLTLSTQNSFSQKVGKNGISAQEFSELQPRVKTALSSVKEQHKGGGMAFLNLPYDWEAYDNCARAAEAFEGSKNLLIAGIGGSALGPQAIYSMLCHPLHNVLSFSERDNTPRFFLLDNVDPDVTKALLNFCEPEDTIYNIISKSGSTAETAAATLLIFDKLKKSLGSDWKSRVIVTTDPSSGDLRQLCSKEGLMTLELPTAVGGRFSVLTPVGLFPAFCLGVDVAEMLAGAGEMAERCLSENLSENPAAQMASLLYLFDTNHSKPLHVMMAYANSLYYLADWFRQLWAESLGKEKNRRGETVNVGPTPIKALGTTDQHSQVQLYIEGPHDKVFLFLEAKSFREKITLPTMYSEVSSLNYLCGQSLNKLMAAEFAATREALAQQNRPSMTITLPEISARGLGEFFMLLEMTTAISGELYNIDAFNQPGVELGKILTYSLMGRKGYEGKAAGIKI